MIELLVADAQEAHEDEQDDPEEECAEPDDLRTVDVAALPLLVGLCDADLQVDLEQPEPDQDDPDVGHVLQRKADPGVEDPQPGAVLRLRALQLQHLQHDFARARGKYCFEPGRAVDLREVDRHSDRDCPQNYEDHHAHYCAVQEEHSDETAEHERALEPRGICEMRRPADLGRGLVELVHPGDGEGLVDAEQDHDVVGEVVVDDVGEVVAHVGAEGQAAQHAEQADHQLDVPLLDLLVGGLDLVLDDRGDGLQDGEAAVHAQRVQREEEDEAPEVLEVQVVERGGVRGEGQPVGAFVLRDGVADAVQVPDGREDCEASQEAHRRVDDGHENRVEDDRLALLVVAAQRGHDPHADPDAVENRGEAVGPDPGRRQSFLHVVRRVALQLELDPVPRAFQPQTVDQQHNDGNDRQTDRELDDNPRTLDALDVAQEADQVQHQHADGHARHEPYFRVSSDEFAVGVPGAQDFLLEVHERHRLRPAGHRQRSLRDQLGLPLLGPGQIARDERLDHHDAGPRDDD